MKVCQVAYTGFGGLGSVVFSLITAQPSVQHQWLVGFIGDQALDPTYAERCAAHGVQHGVFQIHPGGRLRAWRQLAAWLAKTRPDVVVCHGITSILPCWWYAKRHGARLLAVEHTSNQVKSRNEWIGSKLCMLLADKVVLLTDEYGAELREVHGPLYRPRKVVVIPNGIDTDAFRPADAPAPRNVVRLGMAGRFSFSKRQDLLVEMMERLVASRPDVQFELSLAGDGGELARVQDLAAKSPVGAQVRFEGLLSEEALAPWLRGLDMYVHATDGETLSTSLLQAMASGLPIVASDIPGVRNLLQDQQPYGVCVANTPDAFADAVSTLVADVPRRQALSVAARARALERYSQHSMSTRYLALCSEGVSR